MERVSSLRQCIFSLHLFQKYLYIGGTGIYRRIPTMRIKHNNTFPTGVPRGVEPGVVVAPGSVAVAPSLYRVR
jgi:hypothetical protein